MKPTEKQWILMQVPFEPFPPLAGNSQRILALLSFLKKNYRVAIVLPQPPAYADALRSYCDEIWCGPFRAATWTKYPHLHALFNFLIGLSGVVNAFLYWPMLRPYSNNPFIRKYSVFANSLNMLCRKYRPVCLVGQYIWTALPVAVFAKINKIPAVLDTHDIQAVRAKSEVGTGLPQSFVFKWQDELDLLELQDVLIAIQKNEALLLEKSVQNPQVILAEHPFESFGLPPSLPGARTVLFVGSGALHNAHGLNHFIREQWPRIRSVVPDAKLRIVGSVCNVLELESLPESGIEFAGISNQLKNEYSDAAVVINPLLFGSGLKIKSIEAFASGRALVATKVGVEGLEEEFGKAFVVTEFENMYAEIALLLTDYAMRRKYEIRASLLLQERFSPEACFASLKVCLDSLEDKIY